MELYRRLPGGWQPTPQGIYTDLYFWQRLLSLPGTRAASGTRPTVLHFPSGLRAGWSIPERLAEIERWSRPAVAVMVRQQLLDNVLPDRAALDEALTTHERELRALSEYVEALERALADAKGVAADAQAQLLLIADSVTWRLRGRILSVPGVRSAARALARLAAPAAAGRRDRDPKREP